MKATGSIIQPKQPPGEPWRWWKHGVIYHIYPRSFQDSDGDGIGDLQGIIRRLGYLRDLGIDGIWLSPIFQSPMVDFGYDVSDYYRIDPAYGTMDDFTELLDKAHQAGIRVILDMILNHTSDQHEWFAGSRSSMTNPKRNWYIWRDGRNGGPPNNWQSAIGGSAWTLDETTGQYYLHSFFRQQPDLNWREPAVSEAIFGMMKYWLDMGVDGFRFDVINMIAKDKKFRDNPGFAGIRFLQNHRYTRNRKRSLTIAAGIRALLEQYDDRVSIGEIYSPPPGDAGNAARYLATGKAQGVHLAFDFSLIFSRWNAHSYYQCIRRWHDSIPDDGWPCHVLSNHDLMRSIDRYPLTLNREAKARISAMLLLTLKGTPFIYYGEEIGMHNGQIKKDQIRDPVGKRYWPIFSGRDRARTPMQWNDGMYGGFSDSRPWLPLNRDLKRRNVRRQEGMTGSLLTFYRKLIELRRATPALQQGSWTPVINGRNGVLAYLRIHEKERMLIVLNFKPGRRNIRLTDYISGEVCLSTHRAPGEFNYFQKADIYPFEATVWKLIT